MTSTDFLGANWRVSGTAGKMEATRLHQYPTEAPWDDTAYTPDVILPTQYFDLIGKQNLSAEQRLLLAILVDAIRILYGWRDTACPSKAEIFVETEQWAFCANGSPFSFESICECLGIDTDRLRHQLSTLPNNNNPIRLRVKESNRIKRLAVNRVRHGPFLARRARRSDGSRIGAENDRS